MRIYFVDQQSSSETAREFSLFNRPILFLSDISLICDKSVTTQNVWFFGRHF